jgi:2-haloacid dehalogenase
MAAGQFDETVDVLRKLKAGGLRCYALSNMEREAFTIRSARFPFMKWFDGQVISSLEGVAKPDSRIFGVLLARYDLDPQATVFVDDSKRNVEVARDLGFNVVHYTSAGQLRRELRALGLQPA